MARKVTTTASIGTDGFTPRWEFSAYLTGPPSFVFTAETSSDGDARWPGTPPDEEAPGERPYPWQRVQGDLSPIHR
jgi:hypothetical protein